MYKYVRTASTQSPQDFILIVKQVQNPADALPWKLLCAIDIWDDLQEPSETSACSSQQFIFIQQNKVKWAAH